MAGNKGKGVELGPWPRNVMEVLVEDEGQVGSELETLSLPTV